MMRVQFQNEYLTVFESALYRTTSSLLSHPGALLLVDPNWLPGEVDFIRQWVSKVQNGRPLYLLFTHSDYDHILGWKLFPEAEVIVSHAFQYKKNKEKDLQDIRKFDAEHYIDRDYPIAYPEGDYVIHEEGQTLELNGLRLQFYMAPGHTAEGLFTIAKDMGVWIAGDYLSNVEFPFVNQSLAAYRQTMDRAEAIARQFDIRQMVPGHGDVVHQPAEIHQRIADSRKYLDGLEREALEPGSFDFKPMLASYPFLEGLRQAHADNLELVQRELGR